MLGSALMKFVGEERRFESYLDLADDKKKFGDQFRGEKHLPNNWIRMSYCGTMTELPLFLVRRRSRRFND